MTSFALAMAPAVILTACGARTAASTIAPSQLPPAEAFECVMKAARDLGFHRTMFDQDRLQTSASKQNPTITFSSPQFRATWDRLDVSVEPGPATTEIEIVIVTEAEYFSQTGKTLNQLPPSPEVRQAARELEARCDGSPPVQPDSAPAGN